MRLCGGAVRGALVLALLAASTGCSSLLSGSRDDDLTRLLHARAKAVLAGDRAAFLRLVDDRDPDFVATEKRMFDNLQKLPVDRLDYRFKSSYHDTTGQEGVWKVEGRENLRLEDFDSETSSSTIAFTVAEVDDRLVFTAPTEEASYDDQSQPWDLARLSVDRSEHALLVYDAHTEPLVGDGAAEVERAVAAVDRAFPLSWDEHVVVYLLDEPEVLEPLDLVASPEEPGGFAGATVPTLSDDVTPDIVGTRVVLSPAAYDDSPGARSQLLRHEITHEAMGFDIGDDAWFAEGVATYVEYAPVPLARWPVSPRTVARFQKGVRRMPTAYDLYEAGPAANQASYALALMACAHLARTQGPEVLARIYDGLAVLGPEAMSGEQDEVYREVTGLGSEALAHKAAHDLLTTFGSR